MTRIYWQVYNYEPSYELYCTVPVYRALKPPDRTDHPLQAKGKGLDFSLMSDSPPSGDDGTPADPDGVRLSESSGSSREIEDGARFIPAPSSDQIKWPVVIVLFSIVFADALCMSLLVPFLPRMLRERMGIAEEWVGACFGYHMARFFSSATLGSLSDKYGRKNLILFGLVMSAMTTLAAVNVQSLWLLMCLRVLLGLSNVNYSLSKAVLADVTPSRAGRVRVFALWGAAFAISRASSGTLGGLTAGLRVNTGVAFFDKNDFLMPGVIGAGLVLVTLLLAWVKVPRRTMRVEVPGTVPLSFLRCFREVWKDRSLRPLLIAFWVTSYNNAAILMGLTLVGGLPLDSGGLGFSTSEIGLMFAVYGLTGFFFQVFAFPRIKRRFSVRKIFRIATLMLAVFACLFPAIGPVTRALFPDGDPSHVGRWTLVVFTILILATAIMNAVPMCNIMISHMANPEKQGLTQGTADSVGSLMRGCSPVVQGVLFSLVPPSAAPWALFLVFAGMYCLASYMVGRVNEKAEGVEMEALEL